MANTDSYNDWSRQMCVESALERDLQSIDHEMVDPDWANKVSDAHRLLITKGYEDPPKIVTQRRPFSTEIEVESWLQMWDGFAELTTIAAKNDFYCVYFGRVLAYTVDLKKRSYVGAQNFLQDIGRQTMRPRCQRSMYS